MFSDKDKRNETREHVAVASVHPDGGVQLLQHVRVKKQGVAVVGLESHHGHLHLVGLEQDVKCEVHQEIELLVVQTGKDSESISTLLFTAANYLRFQESLLPFQCVVEMVDLLPGLLVLSSPPGQKGLLLSKR